MEAHGDDSCNTSGNTKSSQLSSSSHTGSQIYICSDDDALQDEHFSDAEGPVSFGDTATGVRDCSTVQRPPLLEIEPDIFAEKSQHGSTQAPFLENLRRLRAFESSINLLRSNPSWLLQEQPLPDNEEATSAQVGDGSTHGTAAPPTYRKPHQMTVDDGTIQNSDEPGSRFGEDMIIPRYPINDYSFLSDLHGVHALKAHTTESFAFRTSRYEGVAKEINPKTAGKSSRKKERRSKRQYNKRSMESERKRDMGAANLKKGRDFIEHMFYFGWVTSDMDDFTSIVARLLGQ
jgi:hypothetical protein